MTTENPIQPQTQSEPQAPALALTSCWAPTSFSELLRDAHRFHTALLLIREMKPKNMACDHWSKEYGLDPDEVFEICDHALASPNIAVSHDPSANTK